MRRVFLQTAALVALVSSVPAISLAGPGSASGPITVDSTTFVAGSSVMGTDGGVYSDTLPPIASTTTAAFRMTKYRAEHVNLRDSSGVEFGTTGNPLHTTGSTTVQLSTVQVVNSTISVTGSTVNIQGTVPVSISGTINTTITNSPTVFLATTSVSGSTVTVNGTVTALPSGTQNVYQVNPSTITGVVSITGTPSVNIVNITTTTISGVANVNVVNIPTTTISGTPNVAVTNTPHVFLDTTTVTVSGAVSVTGSTVTINNPNINVTVTNSPTVSVSGVPNVRISSPIVAGTNNIGTVSGSSVVVSAQGGTLPVSIAGTPNVYVTNPTTATITGSVDVTGSTVSITNTGFAVTNTPTVLISGTVPVTVSNSSFSVTGSTVTVAGTVNAVFAGTASVKLVNIATVTIQGTPSVNAIQSGSWLNTVQVLDPSASPISVGYSGGSTQLPAAITDGVLVASMTAVGGKNGLNVNIIGGAGAGGTSSNFTASFPSAGTATGFVGPTGLMQAAAVDSSSDVYVNVANASLNVTGSTVTVNGTVAISTTVPFNISGSTVNVNVNGTVPVNVSNTPNVAVTNTPNVSVTNTVATTLTAQLPTGTNNIGTVSGSTVSISGAIAATISGTINTYQTNPSTVTFNGVAQPVTATITGTPAVLLATTSVSGSTIAVTNVAGQNLNVAATQTGTWNVNATPIGTSTVTFNGISQPVSATISGTPTVNSYTQNLTTVTFNGTGQPVTQSGSWSETVTQSATRWNVNFDTRTTTAVLSSTGVTTAVAISTPIAGISSQTVRVFRLMITVDAATTITFRDGSTNFGDSQYLAANGSIVLDLTNEPWYITSSSNGFVIKQSGSANLGIRIWYTQS